MDAVDVKSSLIGLARCVPQVTGIVEQPMKGSKQDGPTGAAVGMLFIRTLLRMGTCRFSLEQGVTAKLGSRSSP